MVGWLTGPPPRHRFGLLDLEKRSVRHDPLLTRIAGTSANSPAIHHPFPMAYHINSPLVNIEKAIEHGHL